jgi:hypothetical protein
MPEAVRHFCPAGAVAAQFLGKEKVVGSIPTRGSGKGKSVAPGSGAWRERKLSPDRNRQLPRPYPQRDTRNS